MIYITKPEVLANMDMGVSENGLQYTVVYPENGNLFQEKWRDTSGFWTFLPNVQTNPFSEIFSAIIHIYIGWLVVWNMLLFFHILGMSSSQLTHSYFSEG